MAALVLLMTPNIICGEESGSDGTVQVRTDRDVDDQGKNPEA